jgi:Concanavalin A-like lectin/glucanases superfamily
MFPSSAASTLAGTNHVTGISIMGWFKPLGDADNNPSPNTNTENPDDHFSAFGLAGFLRGDEDVDELDGHSVRALLEVINGKVTGLGRRLDEQSGSGQRASVDDWEDVMPPGEWTHLCATFEFNRGRIMLYKNGQPLDTSFNSTGSWDTSPQIDYTSSSNAGGIKIGGSYPDDSQERNSFNGRIDELMFFNKTLTDQEVASQFDLISNIDGDFNLDGMVDSADYVVWRDNLNGGFTPADYLVWKSNFGAVAPTSGAAAVSTPAVPEPGTGSLLALTIACVFGRFFLSQRPRR